ncbi:hypothetical protein [Frankia sp. Cr1]|uniref:hypothetical protein n=1 Tax=Frankia sp. Cr1 TaxID=3073931 RepID=UPI002AD26870|nr:hypothetical protein [Frankia sp. Cr1]
MPYILTCPLCRTKLAALTARCPACNSNLVPLTQLKDLADRHFNEALRHARARQWTVAAEDLAVTLALNPDDSEARALLRKVRYHQERLRRLERTPRPRWRSTR